MGRWAGLGQAVGLDKRAAGELLEPFLHFKG